jgi:hypothetical protein
MTDIVERLRQWPAQGKAAIGPLVIEAADEIERLRARMERLQEEIDAGVAARRLSPAR